MHIVRSDDKTADSRTLLSVSGVRGARNSRSKESKRNRKGNS